VKRTGPRMPVMSSHLANGDGRGESIIARSDPG